MRIVLVNPNPMKPPVTPVSLDYLGAACLHAGIDVDLVDCAIEPDWRNKLSDVLTDRPVLVGVTLRNIDDSYFASQDVSLLRAIPVLDIIKPSTNAPICLGGVGFSIFPSEVLKFCDVSYGICGDGEESLVKLAMAFRDNIELDAVPGLIWMENGNFKYNVISPVSLEKIDLSSRSLFDNQYYLKTADKSVSSPNAAVPCSAPIVRNHLSRVKQ